jgi:hypothetical protein
VANAESPRAESKTESKPPIVIDLGKHRRKRIKQLRSGNGRLMDEVDGCLEELRAVGTLSGNAQPVVVIVRQKRRRRSSLIPGL